MAQDAGNTGISIGTELNQTYAIDSFIGMGGMGEVFRGHNIQTGDPVAIKIVLPEFARDELIIELFRKEARILHHLTHDAIVRYFVFSIDRTLDRPYLAMEFVDGPSLADRLKSGPLTEDDVASLQMRLADGMHKAHLAGVVHRDMSPDNVILPGRDVAAAKIIDFGIAKTSGVGGGTLLGGSFAGKYNYVSPEQLGLFGADVTAKSDIYSLGLVLAAALRGSPIDMNGTQVEVIEKRRVVPDLSDVPPRFRDLLTAMLQPDPSDRVESMATVRDWKTAGVTPDRTVFAMPAAAKATSPPPSAPSPYVAIEKKSLGTGRMIGFSLALLAVVGAGALGGWYYVAQQQEQVVKSPEQKPIETVPNKKMEQKVVVPAAPVKPEPPKTPPPVDETKPAEIDKPPLTKPPETKVAIEVPKPTDLPKPVVPAVVAPLPVPKPPGKATTVAEISSVIADFDGGDCLHVGSARVTENSADVVVYGSNPLLFQKFYAYLVERLPFDPDMRLQQISPPQCVVLAAVKQLAAENSQPISITTDKQSLKAGNLEKGVRGDQLVANIAGLQGRELTVFLVSDSGKIQNLAVTCSKCLARISDDATRVSVVVNAQSQAAEGAETDKRPYLLLAVASSGLLDAQQLQAKDAAEDVIPLFMSLIRPGSDATAALEYFKLENAGVP